MADLIILVSSCITESVYPRNGGTGAPRDVSSALDNRTSRILYSDPTARNPDFGTNDGSVHGPYSRRLGPSTYAVGSGKGVEG